MTRNLVTRAWRGELRRPYSFVVMLVVFALCSFLIGLGVKAAHADPSSPSICSHQQPEVPCNARQFNHRFDKGAYGRTLSIKYSKAFKRFFMFKVRHHAATHPEYVPCPGSPNLGCTWTSFVKHDSCAVSTMPDTFDADSCRASHHLRGLLASPYWKKRGELQTKWQGRIVWCGTVGAIALLFKASVEAAIGAGSGTCLGDRLVP